jgi:hypothetical protein
MKEDRLKRMEEVRKESLEFWRKQMEFAQQKHLDNFEIGGRMFPTHDKEGNKIDYSKERVIGGK